jgi:hypothetical protein
MLGSPFRRGGTLDDVPAPAHAAPLVRSTQVDFFGGDIGL